VNHAVITSKRYNSHAIYGYLLYVKRPYSLSLSPGKTEGGRQVGVRIYSPCMSRHERANISRGACLMH
jgi:hypothetical protein